jgi:hypothetical protein
LKQPGGDAVAEVVDEVVVRCCQFDQGLVCVCRAW